MSRALLAGLALVLAAPAASQDRADMAAQDAAARMRIERAMAEASFVGAYRVNMGQRRIAGGSAGAAEEGRPGGFPDQAQWPWGSLTGQVVAALALQEAEAGRMGLDAPASRHLQGGGRGTTVRRLVEGAARGSADDATLLGRVLERATGSSLVDLFAQRIGGPLGLTAGFIAPEATAPDARWPGGPSEAERREIARAGAAAAMVGTAADLAALDQGLMADVLLSEGSQRLLWRAQGAVDARLEGCAAPVRVVERSARVGRFGVVNVLLPERGMSVALFTNRAAAMGDVRTGGAVRAIVSAAACG